jgi:hypothetical protein
LFVLLWTLVDDAGKARAAPRLLASSLFPYDEDALKKIDTWLRELEVEKCIERYRVDGNSYLRIGNWLKHQKIDRATPSQIPDPSEHSTSPRRVLDEPSSSPRRALATDMDMDMDKDMDEDVSVPTEPHSNAVASERAAVKKVFDHWRTTHGHPQSKLDDKRRRIIRAALKAYPEADLCESITGYLNSPYHMGTNDRDTRYDDIGLLLRDAKHIDAGLGFARDPPRMHLSQASRDAADLTANWRPPELRIVDAN